MVVGPSGRDRRLAARPGVGPRAAGGSALRDDRSACGPTGGSSASSEPMPTARPPQGGMLGAGHRAGTRGQGARRRRRVGAAVAFRGPGCLGDVGVSLPTRDSTPVATQRRAPSCFILRARAIRCSRSPIPRDAVSQGRSRSAPVPRAVRGQGPQPPPERGRARPSGRRAACVSTSTSSREPWPRSSPSPSSS